MKSTLEEVKKVDGCAVRVHEVRIRRERNKNKNIFIVQKYKFRIAECGFRILKIISTITHLLNWCEFSVFVFLWQKINATNPDSYRDQFTKIHQNFETLLCNLSMYN